MPFRETFDCLWCGRPATARDADALEGWAQVCSECIGRAGDNGFLRFRLKAALTERARAGNAASGVRSGRDGPAAGAWETTPMAAVPAVPAVPAVAAQGADAARARTDNDAPPATAADAAADALHGEMVEYYAARASEYDDFYLRRGRYSRGAIHDMAWQVDLDVATRWLDAMPIRGEVVELAAGTGWWSPLLAQKGELWAYDASDEPLERARDRLLAHGLRAHLHRRDAWASPERQVDVVFAGFWLSHVARVDLRAFLAIVRAWLRPGGTFLFIDSRADPQSGAVDHDPVQWDSEVQRRRLDDGREFRVVKVYYEPGELESALQHAGFTEAEVATTSRFFLLGRAVAG